MSACACGSGLDFDTCCGPILAGRPASTAEALMRSRYTAYVVGNLDYIEQSCMPEALKDFDRMEAQRFVDGAKWLGLQVLHTTDGGPEDETGQVEYSFQFAFNGQTHAQHELGEFCRKDGMWSFKSCIENPRTAPVQVVKIGRNDPCTCGSMKKYKKCCGAA